MSFRILQIIKRFLLGKPAPKMQHDYFGCIVFMGGDSPQDDDYWECELIEADKEPISIQIMADINGPVAAQQTFCAGMLADQNALFARCWPVLAADFEPWTQKKFSGDWRDDFELMGFSIPKNGDENNEWEVCYFVDSANHYFTARFESGVARYNEIDG